jgi:uncharacterized membrane protein (UPF0127 family)
MTSAIRWLVPFLVLVVGCGSTSRVAAVFDETDVTVGSEALTVWVAEEPSDRQRGLMEIEELPDGVDGMLFVFPSPSSRSFHMLHTPMPLEVWWFDGDGILIGSTEMKPCMSEPCASYRSPGPVGWALETPLGVHDFGQGALLSNFDSV